MPTQIFVRRGQGHPGRSPLSLVQDSRAEAGRSGLLSAFRLEKGYTDPTPGNTAPPMKRAVCRLFGPKGSGRC